MTFEPFGKDNVAALHVFFEKEAGQGLYSFSLDTFTKSTIDDVDFDPELSIVARDARTGEIIAAFFAVIRAARVSVKGHTITWVCPFLNMFAVRRDARRKGIGSSVLQELLDARLSKRRVAAKKGKGFTVHDRKLRVMASAPAYIWPGLDCRYTAAFFFLKKHGFKKGGERQNLAYFIPEDFQEPPNRCGDYTIARAAAVDLDGTVAFIKKNHPGLWAQETEYSFHNEPISTFIARDAGGTIVGFASHSIGFPGSFGATGVLESLRGKGVGGTLLKWCAYDLKKAGIDTMIIRWVEGDTIKFYSKSIGARVHQILWTMQRRI
nr:GNAT family N-acetyltransferase [Candidatus Sigynarchaeota archaeon]